MVIPLLAEAGHATANRGCWIYWHTYFAGIAWCVTQAQGSVGLLRICTQHVLRHGLKEVNDSHSARLSRVQRNFPISCQVPRGNPLERFTQVQVRPLFQFTSTRLRLRRRRWLLKGKNVFPQFSGWFSSIHKVAVRRWRIFLEWKSVSHMGALTSCHALCANNTFCLCPSAASSSV